MKSKEKYQFWFEVIDSFLKDDPDAHPCLKAQRLVLVSILNDINSGRLKIETKDWHESEDDWEARIAREDVEWEEARLVRIKGLMVEVMKRASERSIKANISIEYGMPDPLDPDDFPYAKELR